ncbi:MAG: hydrogenase expression/formation protein HypE [Candidatus Moraniibacteriota bacterium]
MKTRQYDNITLDMGGGGLKSAEIISIIRKNFPKSSKWKNIEDDGAVFSLPFKPFLNPPLSTEAGDLKLVFTTDAFIVDPIFFPGGDIGKIAMCGTINDLSVMGAKPIGISLSLVIEEGFPIEDLKKIMQSIGRISRETGVPIVTGDTKVTEKGKIDKLEITTAGIGLAENIISNSGAQAGDVIISSGDLGEHTVALLAQRFKYKTKIKSDCKPLNGELKKAGSFLNACKDPTRGGLAANLNEIADKSKVKIILEEKSLPYKKEVVAVTELLGLDKFSLASEGRFIGAVSEKNADKVLKILKFFNAEARIIGRVEKGRGVFVRTDLGSLRKIESPRGKLIPRIC